jgi:hypothetical protein
LTVFGTLFSLIFSFVSLLAMNGDSARVHHLTPARSRLHSPVTSRFSAGFLGSAAVHTRAAPFTRYPGIANAREGPRIDGAAAETELP